MTMSAKPRSQLLNFRLGSTTSADVPAKEHVTLRKAVLQRVQKVPGGHAFAAIHAFDVGGSDLDVFDLAFFDQSL